MLLYWAGKEYTSMVPYNLKFLRIASTQLYRASHHVLTVFRWEMHYQLIFLLCNASHYFQLIFFFFFLNISITISTVLAATLNSEICALLIGQYDAQLCFKTVKISTVDILYLKWFTYFLYLCSYQKEFSILVGQVTSKEPGHHRYQGDGKN